MSPNVFEINKDKIDENESYREFYAIFFPAMLKLT